MFSVISQPSGLSGSSAPPPLIRGTISSNKGSQQVNVLFSSHAFRLVIGVERTVIVHLTLVSFISDQILTGRSSGTIIPPPLVRGGQQVSSKHGSQIIMPPLVRGAQVSHESNNNLTGTVLICLSLHS